jgi:hypothetical protein
VLLAFLVFSGSYAYGDYWGDATLTICNKGSVYIHVVVALDVGDLAVVNSRPVFSALEVSGWTNIAPGACKPVFKETGDPHHDARNSAYIGFAFFDSQNRFSSAGHIGQVPDFGWRLFERVLTKSDRRLCVSNEGMSYRIHGDQMPDCASFHSGGNDRGGYFPLASALYFVPVPTHCYVGPFGYQANCRGGEYYLNVTPTANDTELHASTGSKSGEHQSSAEPGIGDQLMNELGKAVAEQRKRREEMQAEEAVQEKARAGASVKQNVCISDDLTTEWRNPPAGGKMESLKRLLIQSLRERANTPGYDQTRWIVVDSRYYSAWPNTSWGKLVSTIRGGSCGAAGHREILALAP